VPGLDPSEPWEHALDPELCVNNDTVAKMVQKDKELEESGSEERATPEHQPHKHLDMEEDSNCIFKGRYDAGYEITCERNPTLDPILRLHLRHDTIEAGHEVNIDGIKGKMDWSERKVVQDDHSIPQCARVMRASMNLHYAHWFTHGASVDGSKAGVDESTLTGSDEGLETAEDRAAPAAYGCWEGFWPFGDHTPGEAAVTSTYEEKHEALERGLSGGRLPDSFSSVDCEMYAILAYLRKVCVISEGETEADLKSARC